MTIPSKAGLLTMTPSGFICERNYFVIITAFNNKTLYCQFICELEFQHTGDIKHCITNVSCQYMH